MAETGNGSTRTGSRWEQIELERLIEGVKRDLTVAELACSHERTHSAITAAAIRLLPRSGALQRGAGP